MGWRFWRKRNPEPGPEAAEAEAELERAREAARQRQGVVHGVTNRAVRARAVLHSQLREDRLADALEEALIGRGRHQS